MGGRLYGFGISPSSEIHSERLGSWLPARISLTLQLWDCEGQSCSSGIIGRGSRIWRLPQCRLYSWDTDVCILTLWLLWSYDANRKHVHWYHGVCGTINSTLKRISEETKLEVYKVMTLLYRGKILVKNNKIVIKIRAEKMNFVRSFKWWIALDKIKNDDIQKELNIYSVNIRLDWWL